MTSSRNRDSACPDVHQGLARDWLRVEPDEVDRVAGPEGEADLGIELEPSDPGPCPARGSTTTTGRFVESIARPSGGRICIRA